LVRNSVLAAVNPRFSTFTYAFTLAIIVGLMTFGAVVGITVSLMSQCTRSCGLRPVVWLEPEDAPKWYTPLQKAISVSYGAKEALKELTCVNDESAQMQIDLSSATLPEQYVAAGMSWPVTSSVVISSKCSVLHTAECGRKEWVGLHQGLSALANATRGQPAAWPTQAAFSKGTADALMQAALSVDRSRGPTPAEGSTFFARAKFPQPVPAMAQCVNATTGADIVKCAVALREGTAGGTIFQVGLTAVNQLSQVDIYQHVSTQHFSCLRLRLQAPPGATCCNVTLRATDATALSNTTPSDYRSLT
jgi:hypothetical protein